MVSILKYYINLYIIMKISEQVLNKLTGIATTIVLTILSLTTLPQEMTNPAFAQSEMKIVINLTGDEEVPPVQTDAKGIAEISPSGADSIGYTVNATNIQGVTAGHVHLGAKGENGPIVVTLFKYDNPMNDVSENGSITADKLEGPMAGKQISDLAAAGANGTLYVNIHTEKNPNGEIRGQGGNPLAG
jgi:CHRD domain